MLVCFVCILLLIFWGVLTLKLCGIAPFITLKDYFANHGKSIKSRRDIIKLNLDLAPLHTIDSEYGEYLVHPSVLYIPEGLSGKKWWLAVTPYPNYNSKYEQPILFCGESNDIIPPINWEFIGVIAGPHKNGFNSDPNLFFDGKKIWCFWKETKTENTNEENNWHCIMRRSYDGHVFGEIKKMADNNDQTLANVFSPTVMEVDNRIVMLATSFEHERILGSKFPFGRNHLALWILENNLEQGHFIYDSKVEQNYSTDFNYWHADSYMVDSHCYLSLVTDEQAKRILVGVSNDGFHYNYLDIPILSSYANNLAGLYKASLTVVNEIVYIFFPCREGWLKRNRKSNIYVTSISLNELLNLFENYKK